MIKLIKPYISYEEIEDQLKEIFESGIFTKGQYSKLLPEKFKNYTKAQYAFLATSATTALTMCLKLIDAGKGDEIIVSDFSFPASVNVIEDVGATPVFADVKLDTYNMDPVDLERKITQNTKAVICVDALGNPSGLKEIAAICKKAGLILIEDAACAIGSSIDGEKIGSIADLTCFSLHPRKLLTSGEGGVITTNNPEYAKILSYKLNHGADLDSGEFISYGYNYRLPEIACLMACSQIDKVDKIVAERQQQAKKYRELLEPLGYIAQAISDDVNPNYQSIVFLVPEGIDRDALCAHLKEEDIESTIGTYCLSECKYYREKYDSLQENASFLQHNTITLPCYTEVPVDKVCSAIASFH